MAITSNLYSMNGMDQNNNTITINCIPRDYSNEDININQLQEVQKELQDYNYIVYVNLTNVNQVKFVKDFNNHYEFKTKLTPNYPALIYFNDGKISDMIEGTSSNKLTLSKAKDFIEKNKIGD